MNLGLTDKVALVTGASRGLGKAVALGFAQEGANVVICARGENALETTRQELAQATGRQVLAVAADVTRPEDVDRLVQATLDRFGRIDILVTNAGGPPAGTFLDFNPDVWQQAVNLNLMSAVRLCYAVVPVMRQQGGGRIVTITSVSVKQPLGNLILSNSVRMAVIGLTKSLSNELAQDNILVNSVCPSWTLTERVEELLRHRAEHNGTSFEEERGRLERDIPLGRLGRPEEFANVVVFLASECASYLTGVSIQVDGGFYKAVY
jgi:3-oxoacyl-[acyl-carrier protein] reductase